MSPIKPFGLGLAIVSPDSLFPIASRKSGPGSAIFSPLTAILVSSSPEFALSGEFAAAWNVLPKVGSTFRLPIGSASTLRSSLLGAG